MSIRVVDALGTALELPDQPRRIVSLVPSLSETLWWFHVADRVVGVTTYCVAPPHAFDGAERVRGTKNPDVARIVELAPDVVLANQEENRELDVRRLREAGVAVYVTAAHSVQEAADMLVEVGRVVGAGDAGAGLAQKISRAVDTKGTDGPRLRAFVPVWRDPWMAAGTDTYMADLLAHCGFQVVPDVPRYPEVSLQDVRAAGVDVVLLPDEPYAFGEQDRAAFAAWDVPTRLVDGTQLTWYGPRTPYAIGELTRLWRQLRRQARRRQRRRA